jgi:hypothetical protein
MKLLKQRRLALKRGQSLVEMALLLPLLLIMMMIVMDYGRYVTRALEASSMSRNVGAMASRSVLDRDLPNFPNVRAATLESALPLKLDEEDGKVYVGRLVWEPSNNAFRVAQYQEIGTYGGRPPKIFVGRTVGETIPFSRLPCFDQFPIPRDQEIYVTEVYLKYNSISPILGTGIMKWDQAGRQDSAAYAWSFF